MFSNFKFQISNSQRGFTIIELAFVLAILVIFPTIVISNFPQIRLQFSLSRISHKMVQDLRKAQDMSISAVQYKDSNGSIQPVDGYGVFVDADNLGNKQYIIYADAVPSNGEYDPLDYIVETIDFSSAEPGVIIKEVRNVPSDLVSINFSPPDPTTNIVPLNVGENTVEIVFALEKDENQTRTVKVTSTGLVELQ